MKRTSDYYGLYTEKVGSKIVDFTMKDINAAEENVRKNSKNNLTPLTQHRKKNEN